MQALLGDAQSAVREIDAGVAASRRHLLEKIAQLQAAPGADLQHPLAARQVARREDQLLAHGARVVGVAEEARRQTRRVALEKFLLVL
jgi:hypothetical protein